MHFQTKHIARMLIACCIRRYADLLLQPNITAVVRACVFGTAKANGLILISLIDSMHTAHISRPNTLSER